MITKLCQSCNQSWWEKWRVTNTGNLIEETYIDGESVGGSRIVGTFSIQERKCRFCGYTQTDTTKVGIK